MKYNDILTTLRDVLHDNEIRVCDECKKIMVKGYVIEGGNKYYCSDNCLHTNLTKEEFNELYNDGEGETYYTEWNYSKDVLIAINKLVQEAPALQEGELGIRPII